MLQIASAVVHVFATSTNSTPIGSSQVASRMSPSCTTTRSPTRRMLWARTSRVLSPGSSANPSGIHVRSQSASSRNRS